MTSCELASEGNTTLSTRHDALQSMTHHPPEELGLDIPALLLAAGLKPTLIRLQIVDWVRSQEHPTLPIDVYLGLKGDLVLASIYRVMAEMHGKGVLDRQRLASGHIAYTLRRGRRRLEAYCPSCARTTALDRPRLRKEIAQLLDEMGHTGEDFFLYTPCAECFAHPPRRLNRGRRTQASNLGTRYEEK